MSGPELKVEPIPVGLDHFEQSDIATYVESGYGRTIQAGQNPVLVVVDVTYEFCGRSRRDGADPEYPKSAGAAAWDVIEQLAELIPAARASGVPVVYSMNERRTHPVEIGNWGRKTSTQSAPDDLEIVAEIAPEPTDLVIRKTKPSAFFATPLVSWLLELGADTVLVAGGTTSGCVRATVTDAFSHNLRTLVIVDGVFDRNRTSHEVNLFEMQQKYAGLVRSDDLRAWLSRK